MPARLFNDPVLVIATRNQGKAKEMAALLSPYIEEIKSAADFDVPEIAETGETFMENAALKAIQTAKVTRLPALADDSGLMVPALGGRPGIHTAGWAGPDRNYELAMQRVHLELGNNPNRKASFVCALALAWPDGHVETVAGEAQGRLIWPTRGMSGFGYDSMFIPDGSDETFAEMKMVQKQRLSHRSAAFQRLVTRCFNHNEYN